MSVDVSLLFIPFSNFSIGVLYVFLVDNTTIKIIMMARAATTAATIPAIRPVFFF